jgi:Na+/H+-dicarboxylate symporter
MNLSNKLAALRSSSLSARIIAGLVLGIFVGLFFGEPAASLPPVAEVV